MLTNPDPSAPAKYDPRFQHPQTLLYCIGGQKCGTGWLYGFLKQFKQVCSPVEKELQYWNSIGAPSEGRKKKLAKKRRFQMAQYEKSGNAVRRDKFLAFYDACARMYAAPSPSHDRYADVLMLTYSGERVVMDISPSYGFLEAALYQDMIDISPNGKVLMILRDPIARAHSSIRMSLKRAGHDAADYSDALMMGVLDKSLQIKNGTSDFIAQSSYQNTVPTLFDLVPDGRLKIVFFEDLFTLPAIESILAFLGLSDCEPRRKKDEMDLTRDALFQSRLNTKTHAGFATGAPISPEFIERIGPHLAPTYTYCMERFGDDLPEDWQRSAQAISNLDP